MVTWRSILYLAAALTAGGYTVSVLRGPQGIASMQESQRRIREAQQTNDELRKRIDSIHDENRRLQNDAEERDRAVRKHTNKQKPNETTVILPGDVDADEDVKGAPPAKR